MEQRGIPPAAFAAFQAGLRLEHPTGVFSHLFEVRSCCSILLCTKKTPYGVFMEQRGIPPAAFAAFQAGLRLEHPTGVFSHLFEVRSCCSILLCTKKTPYGVFMEQRGIEPLSESSFTTTSPITVSVLTFPTLYAHSQAYNFGSL